MRVSHETGIGEMSNGVQIQHLAAEMWAQNAFLPLPCSFILTSLRRIRVGRQNLSCKVPPCRELVQKTGVLVFLSFMLSLAVSYHCHTQCILGFHFRECCMSLLAKGGKSAKQFVKSVKREFGLENAGAD